MTSPIERSYSSSVDRYKSCEKVPNVDEDCVNRELEIGKDTGRWVPPFNDCQTYAKEVLERCTQ